MKQSVRNLILLLVLCIISGVESKAIPTSFERNSAGVNTAVGDTLRIGSAEGMPGSADNKVKIYLTNAESIAGMQMTVDYDETVLTPTHVDLVGRASGFFTSVLDPSSTPALFSIPQPGRAKIVVFDFDQLNLQRQVLPPGIGAIAEITFEVTESAEIGTVTELNFEEDAADRIGVGVVNINGLAVDVTLAAGTFEVLNTHIVIPGDVSGDGLVNVSDLIRTINIILGIDTSATDDEKRAADINGDGVINIADLIAMISIILGI